MSSILLLAVVSVLLLCLLQPATAAPGRVVRATLEVSKNVASAGELLTFWGRLSASPTRRVELQRQAGEGWVRVARTRTTKAGRFKFVSPARASTTRYRVRATSPRASSFRPVNARRIATTTPVRTVVVTQPTATPEVSTPPQAPAVPTGRLVDPGLQTDGLGPNLADTATVSTSSRAAGTSPQSVVSAYDGSPGRGWLSTGETIGAWLQLGWPGAQTVGRVVIDRPATDGPGALAGFLSFSDGSRLQIRLSTTSRRTVVPISPRATSQMRFTVTEVSPGTTSVGFTHVHVADTGRSPAEQVLVEARPDGNVAATASISSSASDAVDLAALVDGVAAGRPGRATRLVRGLGQWVQLDWARPRELTTLAVAGPAGGGARIRRATVHFSDGSHLMLGAVLSDPTRPTVLSFMPRVTTSVRITFEELDGGQDLSLAEVSAYQRFGTAQRVPGGAAAAYRDNPVSCDQPGDRPSDAVGVVVLCPTNGAAVGARTTVHVATAPAYTAVTATVWPSDATAPTSPTQRVTPSVYGRASFDLDLGALPSGPFTVNLTATGPQKAPVQVYFQLNRTGAARPAAPATGGPAGRSLVYAEEFDRPLALSRTGAGADYSTSKPERTYGDDFGEAVFADPPAGLGNVRVVDDSYLKMSVQPLPPGFTDPQGWGRDHVGGMLASSRPGGSGFSAQYGYFEARMLLPSGIGTWPAFWMLPTPNLVTERPVVAEIDALEHYGDNPRGACHTSHQYPDPDGVGVGRCGTRWASEREALTWHTFAVDVTPTRLVYYIDGREVASAPQVRGGEEPMFFLVNLSLGGGFPINLASVQDRADLYVDYVRVYV